MHLKFHISPLLCAPTRLPLLVALPMLLAAGCDDGDDGDAAGGYGGEVAGGAGGEAGGAGGEAGGAGGEAGGAGGEAGGAGGEVEIGCDNSGDSDAHTAAVVAAAEALYETLSSDQQSTIQYDYTLTSAITWSNLPTGGVPRNGVQIADMSEASEAAAVALSEVAAGEIGATLFAEIRAADQWLVDDGGANNGYGEGLYYVAFVGAPSTTDPWMLQIGGHHMAYNFSYNTRCTSATPLHDATEPTSWTDNGVTHAPLAAQHDAMAALFGALADNSDAQLSGTFGDLVNGPVGGPGGGGPGGGGSAGVQGDTNYPDGLSYPSGATGRGVNVADLTPEQQALVMTAIEAWVDNTAEPVAGALLAEYESDEALAQTYVGFSGTTGMDSNGDYARIDGPRVWIEFSVQGGIIYRVPHYHTLWRDKIADYGAEFE